MNITDFSADSSRFNEKPKRSVAFLMIKSILSQFKSPYVLICFIFIALECFTLVYALGWGFSTSLKSLSFFSENVFGLPSKPEFSNYAKAFKNLYVSVTLSSGATEKVGFVKLLINSLLYGTFPVLIAVFSRASVAYVICKYRFGFNKFMHFIVVFVIVFPAVSSLGSSINFLREIGFYDNYLALLYGCIGFADGSFLIWSGVFKGISSEYMEAAKIDGAGHLRIMVSVMFPLARVPFCIMLALQFIARWNNYTEPLTTMPSMPNLALSLWKFQWYTTNIISWPPVQMAAALIVATPCIVVYLFIQPWLIGNLTAGGLKG